MLFALDKADSTSASGNHIKTVNPCCISIALSYSESIDCCFRQSAESRLGQKDQTWM